MCLATQDYAEVKAALLSALKNQPPGKYYAEAGYHMVEWSKEPGYYLAIYHQGGLKLHFTYPIAVVEKEACHA